MQDDLQSIRQRNARVEADKAWETSWTRRLCIAAFTYVLAAAYMNMTGLGNAAIGALIPTGGYLLSTMSLPFIKHFWLNKIYQGPEKSV
jgi:hypothetical protein